MSYNVFVATIKCLCFGIHAWFINHIYFLNRLTLQDGNHRLWKHLSDLTQYSPFIIISQIYQPVLLADLLTALEVWTADTSSKAPENIVSFKSLFSPSIFDSVPSYSRLIYFTVNLLSHLIWVVEKELVSEVLVLAHSFQTLRASLYIIDLVYQVYHISSLMLWHYLSEWLLRFIK